MTTWVSDRSGGRDRGPRALIRAWVEIVLRPTRFFRTGVAPGDQAPGLVFAVAVTACAAGTHLATRPAYATVVGDSDVPSLILVFILYVVLVGPVVLHLVAALQTVGLVALVPERGGVSETVQVIAYASAPCVLAGLPVPALRLLVAVWGATLLVIGTVIVHEATPIRALAVTVIPGTLVFGYGFGGVAAAVAVADTLSSIV
jgi:hypothetical protein